MGRTLVVVPCKIQLHSRQVLGPSARPPTPSRFHSVMATASHSQPSHQHGHSGASDSADPMDLASAAAEGNIAGVPTHGGHYTQYNIFGNLFEVSAKYVPPIRPIGRGAYGIVWCDPIPS